MSRVLWGLFVEERTSEEEGAQLENRQLVMVTTTRAEAEEFADITELGAGLTSRISFVVRAVEVSERHYRVVEGVA